MDTSIQKNLFMVIIDGSMGAGKTTASKLLNAELKGTARIALSDVKRFISGFETDHRYNKISQEIILVMVEEYLKRGISVVVEWAMNKDRAATLIQIGEKYDAQSHVFQLSAPKEILLERVKARTRQLLAVSELPQENIKNIEENFEQNYIFHVENKYTNAIILDSEMSSSEEIVQKMIPVLIGNS